MKSFWNGFEKKAAEDKKPGYWDRQRGVVRASADKNLGGVIGIANSELIGDRFKKGIGHGLVGGLGGAAAGGVAGLLSKGKVSPGLGAAIGGLLGGGIGETHGVYQADKKYLADRGIKTKYLGFDSEFSPEAQKKYIDDHKKKNK